jgi:hypothetical protein
MRKIIESTLVSLDGVVWNMPSRDMYSVATDLPPASCGV